MTNFRMIAMAPVRFVDSLADRICAVFGAAAFAQFPAYLAQYLQRLGGHRDEAARNVEKYREIAAETGMTIQEYAGRLASSGDEVIMKTGRKIAGDIDRLDALSRALQELQEAPAFKKFFLFLKNMDFDIARAAWGDFTPGLPLTPEGAAYAAAGVVAGMLLYFIVKKLFLLIARRIKGRRPGVPPAESAVSRGVGNER